MHGAVFANNAVNEADLVIALAARFDDRVTGSRQHVLSGLHYRPH